MEHQTLRPEDVEYVADMLRAIVWAQDTLGVENSDLLVELEDMLGGAEDVLRRLSAEMPNPQVERKAEKKLQLTGGAYPGQALTTG